MTKVYLVFGIYPNRDGYKYVSNVFTNKRKAEAYKKLMERIANKGKTESDEEYKIFRVYDTDIDKTDYSKEL